MGATVLGLTSEHSGDRSRKGRWERRGDDDQWWKRRGITSLTSAEKGGGQSESRPGGPGGRHDGRRRAGSLD